jgi:hypothetical protein
MTVPYPLVFLAQVDNTLLDNQQIQQNLRDHFEFIVGPASCARYWQILEDLFGVLGYRGYIAALERYRIQYQREIERASLCSFLMFLMNYPFAERLCPGALEVLKRLRDFGPTVLLLEGDTVFQLCKIERAGLVDAVEGRVSIYIHKGEVTDDIERRYPAERYVFIDNKLCILDAIKEYWGERVTTVFTRRGPYVRDPYTSTCFSRTRCADQSAC